jgi:hypothetical protein
MRLFVNNKKSCLLFHKWDIVKNNGFTIYRKCKKCGARKVTQPKNSGYQPINWEWSTFKTDVI